ncbi:MAG TPA: MoaD/ThiS family protein [Cyclobacteriaceae bacterium]|nr:MoaD/ThiS family protein [Cyclobacteriaceae bacterium]
MKISIVAFGIAREIMKSRTLSLELESGSTIAQLKQVLVNQFPELSSLRSLSFAVGEDYQEDNYSLHEGDEVVVIPPVSGG